MLRNDSLAIREREATGGVRPVQPSDDQHLQVELGRDPHVPDSLNPFSDLTLTSISR